MYFVGLMYTCFIHKKLITNQSVLSKTNTSKAVHQTCHRQRELYNSSVYMVMVGILNIFHHFPTLFSGILVTNVMLGRNLMAYSSVHYLYKCKLLYAFYFATTLNTHSPPFLYHFKQIPLPYTSMFVFAIKISHFVLNHFLLWYGF